MNAILHFFVAPFAAVAPAQSEIGATASYYADHYEGQPMANGKVFRQAKLTCASNHWPMGTRLRVRFGDRTVDVTVTDRTAAKFASRIDLSQAAFLRLSPLAPGILIVGVTRL